MSYILFLLLSISLFFYSLKKFRKSLEIFTFFFPFSLFISVGSKSIMLTEFFVLLLCISYYARNLITNKINTISLSKQLIPLVLFIIFTVIISFLHADIFNLSIHLIRIILFMIFLNIMSIIMKKNHIKKRIINILSHGYILYSFFLFLELIVIKSSIFSNGSLFWKIILQKLNLYPPSVSFEQLNAWSSVRGLSGFTAIHHSLAIYCGIIFIFSIFIFPQYKIKYCKYISLTSFIFLFFTNSRTAIISIIITFIFHVSFRVKLRLKNILLISSLCLPLIFYILLNLSSLDKFINIFYALDYFISNFSWQSLEHVKSMPFDGSTMTRLFYDLNSFSLIADNLFFGVGVLGDEMASVYKPHSTLLINLQMFGIIPVIFLIYFIFRIFKLRKKNIHNINFVYVMLGFLVISSFGTNIISDLRSLFPIILFLSFVISANQKIYINQ